VLYKLLFLYFLLLDGDRDLLFDLRLNHLDEELLVLSVHATCTAATATGVWPTLLRLPAIASEAWNRLRLLCLVHQLLVLLSQFFNLVLIFFDFSGLFGDHRHHSAQHILHLEIVLL